MIAVERHSKAIWKTQRHAHAVGLDGMADARARLQSFGLRALLGPGDRAGPGLSPHVPAARAGRRVPGVSGAGRVAFESHRRRLAARRAVGGGAAVAGRAGPGVRAAGRHAVHDRRGAGPGPVARGAGGDAPHHGPDAAGHGRAVPGLRVGRAGARPRGPVAHRPSRVLAGPNRGDALRHARRRAGRAARCRRHLHRAVHDLWGGGRTRRRGPLLPGLGDGRHRFTRAA